MRMTIKQAIHVLHLPGDHLRNYDEYGIGMDDELKEAVSMAIDALREKAEREDPKPLTLEELRQMHGEPVYLDIYEWRVCYGTSTFRGSEYLELGMGYGIPLTGYGESWFAYRHKPKEVHGDV